MSAIKGPAIFLAQFVSDKAPFNELDSIVKWAAENGYKGIQMPTGNDDIFNLELAAKSQDYCDEVMGICRDAGIEITELSTHLQGQLVAVHPAYDELFDNFAPKHLHGKPQERTEWAIEQLKFAAKASERLGLKAHATFSGALLWHLVYPWPQRPAGLVDKALLNWLNAGSQFWMHLMKLVWMCATKFTPVKTCTTAQPLSVS